MQHIIDVAVSAYGKPWETLCTLKSLMKHSGNHIDKIYLIEEKFQAYNDSVSWIVPMFDNVIHFIPREWYHVNSFHIPETMLVSEPHRLSFRFQYAIEKSDKKYLFLTHTDVLYKDDIVGHMLERIGDCTGIGLIGQCWNCPSGRAGLCNGEKFNDYEPTYDEIIKLVKSSPPVRYHFYEKLDKIHTKPMPECRLNDFACIIDRETTVKENYPNGTVQLFGSVEILDTGGIWFKEMCLKGYKFVHYDISKDCEHSYFSKINECDFGGGEKIFVGGYITQLNKNLYLKAEQSAKEYYEQNFAV